MRRKPIHKSDAEKPTISDKPIQELGNSIYFLVLKGRQIFTFRSPTIGLIQATVLTSEKDTSFRVGHKLHHIPAHHSLTTQIQKGTICNLRGSSCDDQIVIIILPQDRLPALHQLAILEKLDRVGGSYTTKEARINWSLRQVADLYFTDWSTHQLKIESLLINAIAIQVEQIFLESDQHPSPHNDHLEKVIAAKEMIDTKISENYTIAQLAKRVGTNEQYLKKYFKESCGTTIMRYINEQKMQQAKDLILSGNYPIAHIASMVGYRHATHFTSAFKKRFGILPRSLKPETGCETGL
ncbi:MAG: helix-turn-helix transcriptional regulator [Sphingobacterium sp.]